MRVFKERRDQVVAEGVRVFRVVSVYGEAVTIIAVQTILGAEPHEAVAILEDASDRAVREALLDGETSETDSVRGCGIGILRQGRFRHGLEMSGDAVADNRDRNGRMPSVASSPGTPIRPA